MSATTPEKPSALIAALREAVDLVQMVIYKRLRFTLAGQHPDRDGEYHGLLAGTLTSELFGTSHPGERFARFRREHRADIEQALPGLGDSLDELRAPLTDALRVQVLCDHQLGGDSSSLLLQAKQLGLLVEDREVPLPSAFMAAVRILGREQQLINPPENDQAAPLPALRH